MTKIFLIVLALISMPFLALAVGYQCTANGVCYSTTNYNSCLTNCGGGTCILNNCTPGGTVGGPSVGGFLPNPLSGANAPDVPTLLQKIMGALATVAAPIAAIMIVIGAYQILFAGGEPDKITKGKQTIMWAIIGYVIIIIGWGFVFIIKEILGV